MDFYLAGLLLQDQAIVLTADQVPPWPPATRQTSFRTISQPQKSMVAESTAIVARQALLFMSDSFPPASGSSEDRLNCNPLPKRSQIPV